MKNKINIWTMSQFASTPDIPGMQRTYQFAKAFADSGYNVTFWRSSYNHWGKIETINNGSPYVIDKDGSLKIVRIRTGFLYKKNDYRRFLNMLSFASSLLTCSKGCHPAPDVVIGAYPSPFAALAAYKIAKRNSAKFILEIGDLWPQVWIERKAFSKFHPFIVVLKLIEKYLHNRTHDYVSSLPYVNDYLKERNLKNYTFTWIPNGINIDSFNDSDNDNTSDKIVRDILDDMVRERQKRNLNIIYVGGIGVGNRVDCIVQAARILRDRGESRFFFTIVGDGHSKNDIIKYVSDNKLDNVKIWPPIVRKTVPQVLKNADIGILCLHNNPIYRYGVNLNKLYDYMATGLPVVFSANVRNNLVEQYNAGITVPPSDPEAIASALLKLLSMTAEERLYMGKCGYAAIAEDYDIRKLSKKYLELIESL